jgi:hypothetical protein
MPPGAGRRRRRGLLLAAGALALGWALRLRPEADPPAAPLPDPVRDRPFLWRQDAAWARLEADFARARAAGCPPAGEPPGPDDPLAALAAALEAVDAPGAAPLAPDAPALAALERRTFEAAVPAAACPARLPELAAAVARLRAAVKRQAEGWTPGERAAQEALYRALYGGRTALEEALQQAPPGAGPPPLTPGTAEPSATPAATVQGVTVHSGDLLLSRGDAAISSLVARGNDFPGNFSHVALVHVDQATRAVSVVEAHIERGVAVATPDPSLRDRKLRILVLRPRADLPALRQDPLLPHRAAAAALAEAGRRHIPYDFAMDAQDPARLFCSEVAAQAYRRLGVGLWPARSHLSSPGTRRWLAAMGVRHFETLVPSDLEYDPQLRVVAEWRDPEALRQDHLDNAVTDALLEAADAGAPLPYPRWKLPVARLAKAWSALLVAAGRVGPVPEGMSATAALRSRSFGELHRALRERVEARAAAHRAERGYAAPYWTLVRLAREELERSGVLPTTPAASG